MSSSRGKDHPSLDIVSSHGTELAGRRVVLCVAGSVAAYKAIELARLLMRHGADVTCAASNAATRLIRPDYLKWATGNNVITKLSGSLEHIKLADYGQSDLIIVYPATANTLGRLANGMDDTPISTILTVGFGAGIPILMCPAMHSAMYENAAVRRNIEFLRKRIQFAEPVRVEGKAKAPEPEDVLALVIERFGVCSPLRDKRVLMTAGPTMEYIDPVRVITNLSSGRTGTLLASEMVRAGARLTLVYGPGRYEPPDGAKVIRTTTGGQMHEAVRRLLKKRFDVIVMAAAVSDYVPEAPYEAKMDSSGGGGGGGGGGGEVTVRLRRAPKIIDTIRQSQKGALLVGFKAEADVTRKKLVESARKKITESGADVVMANDIGARYKRNTDVNEVLAVDSETVASSGRRRKEEVAVFIRREIERRIR